MKRVLAMTLVAASVTVAPTARANVVDTGVQDGVASAVAGDFDGDGRTDFALTGAIGWTMVPVARTTDSGFTVTMAESPDFAAAAAKPDVKVVTEDFDGDADDDILLVGGAGETALSVARSNRDGTFAVTTAAAGSFPTLAAQPGVRVETGDFNGDSRPDLALLGGSLTTIPVAFSGGTATFTATNAAAPEFVQQAATAGTQVLLGDFDGDGSTDLAAVPDDPSAGDHSVVLALSNGDGTVQHVATPLGDFIANVDGSPVTAADFNGDGSTDLAVAMRNRLLVAYATGGGAFDLHDAEVSDVEFYTQAARDGAPVFGGDFNCDGTGDVAVFATVGNEVGTVLVATGTADPDSFTVTTSIPTGFLDAVGQSGARLHRGDFNDDSCDDFAVTGGSGSTTIPMAISHSNGLFTGQNPAAPGFATWATGARPAVVPPPPPTVVGRMTIVERLGRDSAVAIGVDGLPIIAYHLEGAGDLQVAHCVDVACSAFTHVTSIDTTGKVGEFPAITIGTDGLPLISYVAAANSNGAFIDDLKVAHCLTVTCTSATIAQVDTAARVAHPATLTIDAGGRGVIAYQDSPPPSAPSGAKSKIKLAYCVDVACTTQSRQVIDEVSPTSTHLFNPFARIGLAIGPFGFPVVTYFDLSTGDLLLKICRNADCSDARRTVLARNTNGGISLAIGLDGLVLVSYRTRHPGSTFDFDLKVTHCTNPLCTAATTITPDDSGKIGNQTAITIGGDGFGVIAYEDRVDDDLELVHCTNLDCSAATTVTVDAFDDLGREAAIASGSDGLPLIVYRAPGASGQVLRITQCGNSDCTGPIVTPF